MEIKKSKEANLESKKMVFFFVGLVMVASMVLMAFQYESADIAEVVIEDKEDEGIGDEMVFELIEEEEIEEEEIEEAPPPPEIEELDIVEDDEEIDEMDFSGLDEEPDEPIDDGPVVLEEEPIADFAEIEPSFPGGEAAMQEWIQKHVEYPEMAREMGEQGTVFVQFVVNKDGSIVQVKIVRGVSDSLDAEAKRVVKKMPKWQAGEQAGKKVRVRFTLPINFRLG